MDIMYVNTPMAIVTASETANAVNFGVGEKWTHIIIKNTSETDPCFVVSGKTEDLAEAAAVYPTAGTAPTPSNGTTVLAGQTESYRVQQDELWVAVVMPTGATADVHLKAGQNF